jgi:heat shock protein HslJ
VIAAPPLPTPVPTPTIAPTPAASLSFTADRTTINRGECTTLRWSVENIQAVWVYQQGNDWRNSPVTGQGSQQVCPEVTTTYQMRVQLTDGSVELRSITIVVNQPNTLINTHWMLSRLNMSSIPVSPSPLTLHFSGADSANGFDGCNNFNGPYFAAAGGIAIGPLAGGMMACEDDLMSQATIYRQALQSAQTFTNDGSTLVLFGPGGVEVARFSAIVATPFGG